MAAIFVYNTYVEPYLNYIVAFILIFLFIALCFYYSSSEGLYEKRVTWIENMKAELEEKRRKEELELEEKGEKKN